MCLRLNLQATSRKNTFLPPKELRLLSGVDHPRTYHSRFIFSALKGKQLSHASFRSSGFPGAFGRRNRDINVDSVAEFPTLGASVETVSFHRWRHRRELWFSDAGRIWTGEREKRRCSLVEWRRRQEYFDGNPESFRAFPKLKQLPNLGFVFGKSTI